MARSPITTGSITIGMLSLLLVACSSGKHDAVARGRPPLAPAPNTAVHSGSAEDLWHLRSGLNVAALNCRGRGLANVAPGYNRMIARHRTVLDSAAQFEQARYPGRQYDSHITQVFNRYSLIRNHRSYCTEAQAIIGQINAAPSAELMRLAPAALDRLEAAQRRR